MNFSDFFSLKLVWSFMFTLGSLPFSSKDSILLYSIMRWEIKFAWMYFWRAHNKPTRDMNDAIYKHRTGNCRVFPLMLLRNNFLGFAFWQDTSLLFLNQVWLRVYANLFICHGSEPSLRLTLPGSCNTFIFPWFFSLSLMSQEQLLQNLIWWHKFYI